MGSTVRTENLRVPAGSWLPRRDRGHLRHAEQNHCRREWILDADLAAAFDNIDHDHLLSMLGGFPARGMIRAWLKAGVLEPGQGFAPTEEGTPQGGVISPLLLNVALHGMEHAGGTRYRRDAATGGIKVTPDAPVLVRYADDLLALCRTP